MREFPFVLLSSFLFCPRRGRRAARWNPLHPLGRRAPVAEGGVEWLALWLSVCTEGERKILVVFQFHRILLSLTLSESEVREGWMDEGVGQVLKWPPR